MAALNPKTIPSKSCFPPPVVPVINTRPEVDITKQRICFGDSFSLNSNGQTIITITGAK